MTKQHTHQSHAEIVKRLKRARGHLDGVIGMIEAERSCLDVAQQLHAVEKAVMEAKRTLIHDHLDHCLAVSGEAPSEGNHAALAELRAIARYL
jgi:hypothetical protein NreA